MVEVGDLSLQAVDVAQIERAAHLEDAARLEAELGGDELLELLVEVALDLEAHRLEALAHLEDLLHVLTIVLLLLDALVVRVDVGVARDAQDGGVLRVEIAEAGAEAGADHVLDERVAVALGAGGQGHHALLGRGHLDDAEKPRLGGAGERAGDVEPAAAQVREGVARVDDERARDGRDLLVEELLDGGEVVLGVVGRLHAGQALARELALDEVDCLLVALDERRQRGEDRVELLGGGLVGLVVLGLVLEGGEVGEAAHADHEPLVQVGVEDLAELEALKEGDLLVVGLVEHAVVEPQPAELAVLGIAEVALGGGLLCLLALRGLQILFFRHAVSSGYVLVNSIILLDARKVSVNHKCPRGQQIKAHVRICARINALHAHR